MLLEESTIQQIIASAQGRVAHDRDKTNVMRFIHNDFNQESMTIARALVESAAEVLVREPPSSAQDVDAQMIEKMKQAGRDEAKALLLRLWRQAFSGQAMK